MTNAAHNTVGQPTTADADADTGNELGQQLENARSIVQEIDPAAAYQQQKSGSLLIDVRAAGQCCTGIADQAINIQRDQLIIELSRRNIDQQQPLMTICALGKQSLLAAAELLEQGYQQVQSVQGGLAAWREANLPLSFPDDSGLSGRQRDRYARHLTLPEIGPAGQQRLLNSKVLLIGAGGLGSPAALYLTAAGIGALGIVDDDRVELSNLQRQVLHNNAACGDKKIDSAQQQLRALNPDTEIKTFDQRLTDDNAAELIADYDVVIDGSDNFATRYAINRACVEAGKPLVYAAVEAFKAQVAVFWPAYDRQQNLPCYHCVFPQAGDGPSCVEAGVLGVVPGIAGMLQAAEALKLCLQTGQPLVNRMLRIDTLAMRFTESNIMADPDCPICASAKKLCCASAKKLCDD